MPMTIPNQAAATYSPQAQMFESDIDALVAGLGKTGVLTGCAVAAQGTPNMTVSVSSGQVQVGGSPASVTGGNVTITAASGTLNRIDHVVSSSSGVLSAVTGTPAANPIAPAIPANSVILATIYVFAGATSVTNAMITNKSAILGALAFFNIADPAFGAVGDGATDNTTAIANCLTAAGNYTQATGAAAAVVVPPGVFITAPFALPNRVGVLGFGVKVSILKLKNGSNATFVTNHVSSNGTTDPNAEFCFLRSVMLDCNKANQTGTSHGVFFTTNPLTTQASGDDYFDTHHLLENVIVFNALTNGYYATGRGEHRLKNVWVYSAGQDSFVPTFDSFLDTCTSDHAGRHGFNLQQTSIIMAACKAFYSGQVTTGHGFYLNGGAYGISLSSCYAQDNVYGGFALDTISGVTLSSCVADSNSTGGAGVWPGVDLWATTNSKVDVLCFDRKANGTTTFQTNAVRLRSTSTGNSLFIKHFAVGGATVSNPIMTGSTLTQNEVVINNLNAFLADTFAATYVPDPYLTAGTIELTLTANITINVPTQTCAPGTKLTLVLIQDATGGRTMTFGAGYRTNWTPVTTASKANMIAFVYDGTSWFQVASATGL